jgi:hypothetical protein
MADMEQNTARSMATGVDWYRHCLREGVKREHIAQIAAVMIGLALHESGSADEQGYDLMMKAIRSSVLAAEELIALRAP